MNNVKWHNLKKKAKVRGKFKVTVQYTAGPVKRQFPTKEERETWINSQLSKSTYISHKKW